MDAGKPSLSALAELEGVILELERAKAALPQAIERAEARASAAKDTAAKLRSDLDQNDKQRRAREAEAQDVAAKRDKLHAQSAVVKTNKEYTTLLHEIDAHNKRISEIEDEILTAMERAEGIGEEVRRADASARQVTQEVGKETEELRAKLAEVERRLATGIEERTRLLGEFGAQVSALYNRAVKARGNGIARIEQATCSGCHRTVPPEVQNRVKAGEVHICVNCQRIFVLADAR
ncbi:MAG TPA: C4-type zinc ribbon domain-containing protein [Myxococcota bacterium]|nr:C4-type zinc ribbon domain-containing protein [Myxococcota bacterium]